MKVYLAIATYTFENSFVLGVFETEQQANAAIGALVIAGDYRTRADKLIVIEMEMNAIVLNEE